MKKKLAVVIPMYNVDLFLENALDTLLVQDLTEQELQVILVDDGSTDNTGKIAKKYVTKYPNVFEYHLFENGGLGASRNRGTRLADSDYITYFDPDDEIVPGSYRLALDILHDTDSDILIGGTKRFNSKKVWNSWIHSKAEIKELRKIKFSDRPELVWDSTAWNKLYKLDFIRENNLYTPEGILYEDMPMVVPALTLANSIDVMKSTLYMWRSRDFGAPSITQMSSNETKPLIDRLFAMKLIITDLKKYGASEKIFNAQLDKFLNFDVMVMFAKDKFELFTKNQKKEIFNALREFLQLLTDKQIERANFHDLVYFRQILKISTVDEFSELTINFLRGNTKFKGYWQDGLYRLTSDLSTFSKSVTSIDMKPVIKIEEAKFEKNKLIINGFTYAKFSDMSSDKVVTDGKISLLDDNQDLLQDNAGSIVFKSNHRIMAAYGYNKTHFNKDGADFNYNFSGYEITIELDDLKKIKEKMIFLLTVNIDGVQIREFIKNPISGHITRPDVYISDDDNAYQLTYDKNSWVMQLEVTKKVPVLRKNEKNQLVYNSSQNDLYLQAGNIKKKLKVFNNYVYFPLELQRLLKKYDKVARHKWQFIKVSSITGRSENVYFSADSPLHHENNANLEFTYADQNGFAVNQITRVYPILKSVAINNNKLSLTFKLSGWLNEACNVQIIGDPKLPDLIWNTTKVSKDLYHLYLPLNRNDFSSKPWLNFYVRLTFKDGYQTNELLRWGPDNFEIKNNWVEAGNIGWLIWEVNRYELGGFAVKRTDNRVYRQRYLGEYETFLETDYQQWVKEPLLEKTVVWSSYWGKGNKLESNPGALFNYFKTVHPEFNNVIVLEDAISDYSDVFPDATVISFNTKEYWYYLAKAKYFVNDVNFEEMGRIKRSDQIEIQTMHGTPLKKMGFEVLSDWRDGTYENYLRKNKNWDYLIVPSDYVAEVAQRAYAVHPKLLKTGYPRNDLLLESNAKLDLCDLKKKLNLPLDKRIILYAPTWRLKGQTDINKYIDVKSLYENIPSDVVILLRSHTYEKWVNLSSVFWDKIRYAPQDSKIEDLYLASDAVITDYSSVMFDYALLDKPMMFFAFDYEEYITKRGINFDLKQIAPGPFLEKQSELEMWLNKFEIINSVYSNKIKKFKNKFCQFETGHASEKIVKEIWN